MEKSKIKHVILNFGSNNNGIEINKSTINLLELFKNQATFLELSINSIIKDAFLKHDLIKLLFESAGQFPFLERIKFPCYFNK